MRTLSRRTSELALPLAIAVTALLVFATLSWAFAPFSGQAFADEEAAVEEEEQPQTPVEAAVSSCVQGLLAGWEATDAAQFYANEQLDPADGTSSWLAFDVYRAGLSDGSDAFLDRLERYVTDGYAGEERGIDSFSSTTWSRTAIVAMTLGADSTSFGRTADGQPANLLSDGIFNWSYTQDLGEQGSNAWIYALQAIDATGMATPAGAAYSASNILASLLACQAADGSFALSPGSATGSIDLTGMALAALGPHKDDPAIRQSIEAALAYLSENQDKDGGFSAEGEATSESCSMVIVGLSACGIDAETDERFSKKGGTPVDALLSFAKADGTFGHVKDDVAGSSRMQDLPTEQALRALLALEELRQGGDGNVYTSDVAIAIPGMQELAGSAAGADAGSPVDWATRLRSMAVGCALALALIGVLALVRRKNGHTSRRYDHFRKE